MNLIRNTNYTLALEPYVVEGRVYFVARKRKETWITSTLNFLIRCRAFLWFVK